MKFHRGVLVLALACVAPVASAPVASAVGVPAAQKFTVKLGGDCADRKMDEAGGESTCELTVTILPKSPNRSLTLQELAPGKKSKWTALDKERTSGGSATFEFSAMLEEDGDEYYRDGTYKFRVTATKTSKEKAYTSSTVTVAFNPDDSGGDDTEDGSDTPTATTAPKTTQSTVNGGTPTNTTTPGGDDTGWFTGANASGMNAFCQAGDPYYVGATICSGISTRKSLAQFKALISTIDNAPWGYRRNGFCMQAMWLMGGLTQAQREAKCVEANAGR